MTAFENTPIRGGGTSNPTSAQRSQTAAASPTSTKFKHLRVAENFYRRALEAEGLTPEQQRKREAENNSNRPKRTGPPRLLMCYLCGQQFGTSSLAIHQPQCYYKKLLQWEKNPPEARGPKPIHPDEHAAVEKQKEETIEEYNDRQFQQYTEMMVECDLCHRRFLPDRFVVHKRSCRVGGTISKPVLRSRSTPHTGTAPDTGRSTLEHEKKSVTFKGNTVEDGEEEEQEDATDEKASKSMVAGSIDRDTEDEEHGTRLQRTIDEKTRSAEISASLEPCPLCGRKYLTSKLEAHVAICKGKTLSSSVVSPSTSNLVPCCYCERKFDPSRVAKHESVCLERKNVRVGAVSNKSSPAPTATKTLATPSRAHVSGASPGTSKSENQKFCTQCGMKYQPSASTKFCSECGMRLDSSNV